MKLHCLVLFGLCVLGQTAAFDLKSFWMTKGEEELRESLLVRNKRRLAKNVIIFVGEGMGMSTVAAARAYKAGLTGQLASDTQLSFEQFPNVALSKTYCADNMICDSASTGTAIFSGVKANSGTLGVTADVSPGNCSSLNDEKVKVKSILNWFVDAGKSVGIVTTSRVTSPVPASTYAHSVDKGWESDVDMADSGNGCGLDVASQLVFNNPNIQVILGGGRAAFMNRNVPDPETGEDNSTSSRLDGQDLIEEWLNIKTREGKRARYVWHAGQFRNTSTDDTDYLLGLFNPGDMEYDAERDPDDEPSIGEMTEMAIDILSKNDDGFFLLVHGGRIESGYQDNDLELALAETVALDDAVGVAMERTDQDTLLVVTADHAEEKRDTVTGSSSSPVADSFTAATVDPVYVDMSNSSLVDENASQSDRNATDLTTASEDVPDDSEAVGQSAPVLRLVGQDVPIYASGPMSLLFHGVHEQSFIAHALSYAACVGPHTRRCDRHRQRQRTWAGRRWTNWRSSNTQSRRYND